MKMPETIDAMLLAPCGVNCMLCAAHLDKLNAPPSAPLLPTLSEFLTVKNSATRSFRARL